MKLFLYHIRNAGLYPPNWRTLRKGILAGDPFCEFCGSKRRLEVHHVVPVHVAPGHGADPLNLIVLCSACHLRFGHLGDYRRFWDPDLKARARASLLYVNTVRGSES